MTAIIEPLAAIFDPKLAARHYASLGWRVFPIYEPSDTETGCSCDRLKCKHPGKHPRTSHGVSDASTRLDRVDRWWDQWPKANVGIATGSGSGIVVLDVDPRHGGDVSLAETVERYASLPSTPTVRTGGGLHLYFRHLGAVACTRGLGGYPGLDLRGDGGYVVAPPSIHKSGNVYVWDTFDAR